MQAAESLHFGHVGNTTLGLGVCLRSVSNGFHALSVFSSSDCLVYQVGSLAELFRLLLGMSHISPRLS